MFVSAYTIANNRTRRNVIKKTFTNCKFILINIIFTSSASCKKKTPERILIQTMFALDLDNQHDFNIF